MKRLWRHPRWAASFAFQPTGLGIEEKKQNITNRNTPRMFRTLYCMLSTAIVSRLQECRLSLVPFKMAGSPVIKVQLFINYSRLRISFCLPQT